MAATILVQLILWFVMMPAGPPGAAQGAGTASSRSPHGALAIPCQNCHTASGWKPIRNLPEFDHSKTRFPLRGLHENVACTQCHTKPVFSNTGTRCADCHADIHRRQMGASCEQCHTVKGWKVSVQSINNHQNRFPLVGAHAALECDSCHKGAATGQFQGLSTDCYACHAKDYQKTSAPNHTQTGFPPTCQQCHGMDSWFSAKFDHLKMTGFALDGAHTQLPCTSCHLGGRFQGTASSCVGCHLANFQQATNPNHVQGGFPQTCQQCHNTAAWSPAKFDHNAVGFPLTGGHLSIATCAQCHVNGNYNLTSANTACVGCHLKDYQSTTNPNHAVANFPQTCEQCHTTAPGWGGGAFDHSTTGWALTGGHLSIATCAQCHVNGNYTLTSANTACVGCHLKEYQGTSSPNHAAANFPQTCEQCHTTAPGWGGGAFDHSTTGWALTGGHLSIATCAQCHVNGNYTLTSANTACVGCHLTDYQKTTNPNHVQANFPQTCQQCHTTAPGWGGASFDHASTGWALTGGHLSIATCAQCHVNGNYTLTSANTACAGCHLKDYQSTTNPNHVQANFPQSCQQCHTTAPGWGGASFNHASTGWALTGGHLSIATCTQCHVNGNYTLSSANTQCAGCHMADFNATTNPNHAQAGFPTDCSQCHSTAPGWGGASFNHASTGWALTGFHASATVQCQQCHVNGNYKLTTANTVCVSCHLTNYQATTAPPHAAVGFPQTCQICHSTTDWTSAPFNHSTTTFPLVGFHATSVTCAQCHVNNNYLTLPTACSGCHLKDYQGTTSPNHIAAGFPTTCQTCHQVVAGWLGATFNHTYFPLNHGNANGVCSTCHTNPADYKVFLCTGCHTKSQTDSNHQGVGGYVYNSVNCYQCHKN